MSALLPVLVVDVGIAVVLLGLLSLLRPLRFFGIATRGRAARMVLAGLVIGLAGGLLPAPEKRAAAAAKDASQLDKVIPVWQFAERHETRIHASPAAVEKAVRSVSARDIALFRLLTWLRSPRLPWLEKEESILSPPADEPILSVALRSGFQELAKEPGKELVFGSLVMAPASLGALPPAELRKLRAEFTAEKFRALADPGYAKAVMNFRWMEEGDGWTRLVTETRVFATDSAVKRRFGIYWRAIYPGSSLLRRTWLAAIRHRAEAG
mgnify:CR=1 FL=1